MMDLLPQSLLPSKRSGRVFTVEISIPTRKSLVMQPLALFAGHEEMLALSAGLLRSILNIGYGAGSLLSFIQFASRADGGSMELVELGRFGYLNRRAVARMRLIC
jgi:hypothetical protein